MLHYLIPIEVDLNIKELDKVIEADFQYLCHLPSPGKTGININTSIKFI